MRMIRIASFLFSLPLYAASSTDFLQELVLLPAASGYEKPVRDVIKSRWQKTFSDLQVDGMGNVIAQEKGSSGPRVLLMAHMDEIGFMVESITKDGYLHVVPLGGIADAVIYAHRWDINTPKGKVIGYSGMDSPHLLSDKEKQSTPQQISLFLDIGAKSNKEVMDRGVRVGAPVTPLAEWTPLGSERFLTKALDDRAGLAIITDVIEPKTNHPNQLSVAATVQEEIGLRGASTVYQSTNPDVVINIEVGIADDYPDLISKRKGRIILGNGPTLFVYDKSMIPNQELLAWIDKISQENAIPVQYEVETGYGEDGAKLQASGQGVPVINIGIPVRYAHQEGGVFDRNDYENTVKLVQLIVSKLDATVLKSIRE